MEIDKVMERIEDQSELIKLVEDFSYLFKEYEMGLLELKSDIEIIDLEWQAKYGYSPFEHVKTRIKSPLSLKDKLKRKGIDYSLESIQQNIFDIIGVRIVTTFEDDVYKIYDILKGRNDLRIKRVKDYIKNPKPSGYKSLHLIVETELVLSEGVKWVPAEIQIRTLAMDFFASTEHKLQYKYNTKKLSDSIRQELREVADVSSVLDRKMTEVRNTIMMD
ncbi:GTP pyrophosphokinase [Macrococcus armenti]|uniref:GTP pyrophosphokinase n=1 Tax=Macrococcus armenti TaxID=2875764 RepID=UPI001CCD2DC5|nr:GTP pyrophosphokinase family protein [Macrococcus armenti]UBH09091.1 GTP pyrophosphokinase family protein [Macrococcus armenti]UBH11385.1 GTP pyrophosphokinase family protein [Macrococcus armenti]UBH15871.1 GTP pyrophosphokinase family protein [Macrococcus armenti]UBH18231.1 GTP pyrophosphokinase family protein [Macrococcus armenti]UBH20497.1 GTP pyrophosphokinase family protein [Macrococcus armenti]